MLLLIMTSSKNLFIIKINMKLFKNNKKITTELLLINISLLLPIISLLIYVFYSLKEENRLLTLSICVLVLLIPISIAFITTYNIFKSLKHTKNESGKELFSALSSIKDSSSLDLVQSLLKSNEASKLKKEMAKAADYVISLIPKPINFQLGQFVVKADWRLIPSIELGGDSCGYHWIDDENFAMYLLDVCQHGIGPALLSVSVLNVLRSQSLPNCDFLQPSKVLESLNDTFQMSNQNDLYFTCWYGVFNKNSRQINYASAGHPPAILINSKDEINELITPNFIIGGLPDIHYESNVISIPSPSDLYIYSDGIYEVQNPEGIYWTVEELQEYLKTHRNDITELDSLYKYLLKMGDKSDLDDDFTILKISFI
jgi:serine phosphatase RsbU (regulator of sigma subunit)